MLQVVCVLCDPVGNALVVRVLPLLFLHALWCENLAAHLTRVRTARIANDYPSNGAACSSSGASHVIPLVCALW